MQTFCNYDAIRRMDRDQRTLQKIEFIGNIGEQGLEFPYKVLGFVLFEGGHEAVQEGVGSGLVLGGVKREQLLPEAVFHLLVGKAQVEAAGAGRRPGQGEVAALVEEGQGAFGEAVQGVERGRRDGVVGDLFRGDAMPLEYGGEEFWSSGLEPVVAHDAVPYGGEQAEGVVDVFGVRGEAVAVIAFGQGGERLFAAHAALGGQSGDALFKAAFQFVWVMPQMAAYWGSMEMSLKLLRSLNLLMSVRSLLQNLIPRSYPIIFASHPRPSG